jgi:hypothetical protein
MGARTLFMNGITVTVPQDTVLEFFFSSDIRRPLRKVARAIVSKRVVEFSIGGLLFRTKAEIIEEFPDSLFAVKLSKVAIKKDGVTRIELDIPECSSPELFPMVFDFLLRRYSFNTTTSALPEIRHIPPLRTVELSTRQSALMDAIEKAVFGIEIGGDAWELAQEVYARPLFLSHIVTLTLRPQELTGPRYYINSSSKMVCVARPPPGVAALPEMCVDPQLVHLVMDRDRPAPKKAKPSRLVDDLKRRYALDAIDVTSWDTVEIPRGVPFVFREGADGLEVVVKGCERRAWDLADAFRVRVA